MTVVTGLTAARMEEIEAQSVVDGSIVGDNLILERHDGGTIDAGNVRGPIGPTGSGYVICTSSTRPSGLIAGDEGLAIYETDTGLRRYWTGTAWLMQERVICTSSTRPSMTASDEGVEIYETDTERRYIWDGTQWVSLLAGREYVLYEITRTADSSPAIGYASEHEFSGYNRDITVVSGRRYYVKFGYKCAPSLNGMKVTFSVWSGAVGSGTRYNYAEFTLDTTQHAGAHLKLLLPTGAHTLRFSAKSNTSGETFVVNGDNNWPGIYQIIEIGN